METVRQIINSNSLDGIISLPKFLKNKKVEITISLIQEDSHLPSLSKKDIDEMLHGSITESLVGILPPSKISLEEYRSERLSKYERTN